MRSNHDKIFGFYNGSDYKLVKEEVDPYFKRDESNSSFIFSLDYGKTYHVREASKALYCK